MSAGGVRKCQLCFKEKFILKLASTLMASPQGKESQTIMVCSSMDVRENEPQNNLLLASRFYLVSIFRYFSKYDTKFSLSLDVVAADVQSRSRSWHVFPVVSDDVVSVSSSISCKQKYNTLLVLQSKMQSFFKPLRHFKVMLQTQPFNFRGKK